MRLQGKTAMVTGAGRGIGAAIAEALAAEGAAVAACDLDGTAAAKTAAGLAERHGVRAVGVGVDIADSAAVRAAVSRVRSELGPPDILVNNAGIDAIELFVDSAEQTWDKIIAVNLRGTMTVTRAVLDGMIERGSGRIIHIASDAGRVGSSGEVVYSATKGGVIAFGKAPARDHGQQRLPRTNRHRAAGPGGRLQPEAVRRAGPRRPAAPGRPARRRRARGRLPRVRGGRLHHRPDAVGQRRPDHGLRRPRWSQPR